MINFRFASFWNIRTPDWCQFCLAAENKLNICWRNPMTLSLFRNTTIQRGVPAQIFRNHCSLITSRQFILSMYVFQFMFSRFKRNNLAYGYANQQTNKITWNRTNWWLTSICQRNTAPIVKLEMILSRDIFSKLWNLLC